MNSLNNKFSIVVLLLILFVLLGSTSMESFALTVQTGSFKIDLGGKKTWSVKAGIGEGNSLSSVGFPKNSYSLAQTLKVDLNGEIGKTFSVSANLDDTKPGYLQKFELRMDTENWDGLAGDIVAGEGKNFSVYNKKILGLRLNGTVSGAGVELIGGRLQGISETKVFYGDTAETEVEFSLYRTGAGLEEAGYEKNIRGLQYYELDVEYVEGFTDPEIEFLPDEGLQDLLEEYLPKQWAPKYVEGLVEVIGDQPKKKLSAGQFDVVSLSADYLILLQKVKSLVRNRVQNYISAYNKELPEDQRKDYPFNPGTKYETEFLEKLETYIRLALGKSETLELDSYERRRFYSLGRTGIKREGFQLEVKPNGGWSPVEDLTGYDYELFPDRGILDLDAPKEFFTNLEKKGIRASFKYEISGKTYMLGFSVAPESEKVYLNGELLKRNTDYSIDYETGALIIFTEVGPDDKIKVDFERARGGLGGFAQFGRNLYGFSTSMESDYGLNIDLNLFQARDSAPAELPPEVPTMPNVHTVAGLNASYKENGWQAGLKFGGNINRFPFDDNSRVNLPNRINQIVMLENYDMNLFLDQNGFTVARLGGSVNSALEWENYGPADGLAGKEVKEGLVVEDKLFLATESGLTTVTLTGSAPFGQSVNWNSYRESDGLPEAELSALTDDGETLWIGTSSGVISVGIDSLEEPDPWKKIEKSKDLSVTSVAYLDGLLGVGTGDGFYLYDISTKELTLVEEGELNGVSVNDVAIRENVFLAGTEAGIYEVGKDGDVSELVGNKPVNALSVRGKEIWFGTDAGFARVKSGVSYGREKVTALLANGESVWAGSEGDLMGEEKDLVLYELGQRLRSFSTDTTGIEAEDEDRFRSIDPDRHTDRGIFVSGKLGKTFGFFSRDLTVSTDFEYYQPTYTPIGRTNRRDRVSAGARVEVGLTENLSLGLGSDYSVASLSADSGDWSLSNNISLYWKTLVNTSLDFAWNTKAGGDTNLKLNLALDKSFWEDSLIAAVDVAARRKVSGNGETTDSLALASQLTVSPWGLGEFGLNYTVPVTLGSLSKTENERLTWNFDISRTLPLGPEYGVELGLNGEGKLDSPLLSGVNGVESLIDLNLEPDKLKLDDLEFSPGLNFSWKGNESSNQLSGELSLGTGFRGLASTVSVGRTARFPNRSKLVEYRDSLQGSFSYDFGSLAPEVNYKISRNLLTHPDFGRKVNYSGNLNLGAAWKITRRLSSQLEGGLSYESDQGFSYTLKELLDWKINSKLAPEVDISTKYFPGSGKLDFNAETEFSYPFRDRWGVSFVSGINLGVNEDGEVYDSYYGSTGLEVKF